MKVDIIIRSTDTDLLAAALINHTQLKFGERNIVIHFGKVGQEFVYYWINQLVKLISSSATYSLLTTYERKHGIRQSYQTTNCQ